MKLKIGIINLWLNNKNLYKDNILWGIQKNIEVVEKEALSIDVIKNDKRKNRLIKIIPNFLVLTTPMVCGIVLKVGASSFKSRISNGSVIT